MLVPNCWALGTAGKLIHVHQHLTGAAAAKVFERTIVVVMMIMMVIVIVPVAPQKLAPASDCTAHSHFNAQRYKYQLRA